jgi:hypothetical protein
MTGAQRWRTHFVATALSAARPVLEQLSLRQLKRRMTRAG